MKILAIDTSTKAGSIALINKNELIIEHTFNLNITHSEYLLSCIDQLFKNANLDTKSLEKIAVALGPGSFTGLRVGISCARALAQCLKIPIVGIPSLDALIWMFRYTNYFISPILDARKGEIYTSLYKGGEFLKRIDEYYAISPEKWAQHLKTKTNKKILFIGNGLSLYQNIFEKELKNQSIFTPTAFSYPCAKSIAFLGKEIDNNNLNLIKPLYVRLLDLKMKK